jgi:hypothetical protein
MDRESGDQLIRTASALRPLIKVCSRPIADGRAVCDRSSMIIFALILLLGFLGGFAIGAVIFGPWRRRLVVVWATLPLAAYLLFYAGLLIWGAFQSEPVDWNEALSWFLVGLFGFVGLPVLLFAGSSVLGFIVAPAPKRAWRLRDLRLPQ